MKAISSIEELIQELGGVTKAAATFSERVNVVGNWQFRNKMPANKYLEHQGILKAHGIKAPSELWFREPTKPETAEREQASAS